ncbi:MAG: hypothetical protein AVDCRST_MAG11-2248 [uncultured Gemmatimonadaceae bacterium]|uniref:Uncharacterized protein n=1 Tax=uncultured Gemmatimonadaceae bacterium TaxID=246130 RepID=A0A6J4LA42_9BACT|nr:MAG: hypothetical protein AVDCRST_MAG11-2248 [uncultured Gemmatimonadaceae bacterium]
MRAAPYARRRAGGARRALAAPRRSLGVRCLTAARLATHGVRTTSNTQRLVALA